MAQNQKLERQRWAAYCSVYIVKFNEIQIDYINRYVFSFIYI